MHHNLIYLDNASTSFPKPPEVLKQIENYINNFGVTPAHSDNQLSNQAEAIVLQTRKKLAILLGVTDHKKVSFTINATHSLNTVIQGFLREGDHALICNFSHNSAIRPLEQLRRQKNISFDRFTIDEHGKIDSNKFKRLIRPETKLIILNHVSNVLGVKAPLEQINNICKKKRIPILLDVTQSIVYEDLEIEKMGIDFVAGTGHKTLLGPSGLGFLYVANPKELPPFIQGGSVGAPSLITSHPLQPPFRFEAGTPNTTGIAGLLGGLEYIEQIGINNIREHSKQILIFAHNELEKIKDVKIYGSKDINKKVPIISFSVAGALPSELAYIYANKWGIVLRSGIHCAPWIHETTGTLPTGTLRISMGNYTTKQDIEYFIKATIDIINRGQYAKVSA
jgi:cysteine desulfurase family protein